jgi:hypothetical protein
MIAISSSLIQGDNFCQTMTFLGIEQDEKSHPVSQEYTKIGEFAQV